MVCLRVSPVESASKCSIPDALSKASVGKHSLDGCTPPDLKHSSWSGQFTQAWDSVVRPIPFDDSGPLSPGGRPLSQVRFDGMIRFSDTREICAMLNWNTCSRPGGL